MLMTKISPEEEEEVQAELAALEKEAQGEVRHVGWAVSVSRAKRTNYASSAHSRAAHQRACLTVCPASRAGRPRRGASGSHAGRARTARTRKSRPRGLTRCFARCPSCKVVWIVSATHDFVCLYKVNGRMQHDSCIEGVELL